MRRPGAASGKAAGCPAGGPAWAWAAGAGLRPGPIARAGTPRRGAVPGEVAIAPTRPGSLAHSRTRHLPLHARIPRSRPSPLRTPPLPPSPFPTPCPRPPSQPRFPSPAFFLFGVVLLLVWVCSGWAISQPKLSPTSLFFSSLSPGSPAQQLPHPELGEALYPLHR